MTFRVCVTGGRLYANRAFIWRVLSELHAEHRFTALAEGGASGADVIAGQWADMMFIPHKVYRADWEAYGRKAGPIRNQDMLQRFKPHMVVAFRGGSGTAHCVMLARRFGIHVIERYDDGQPVSQPRSTGNSLP